MAEATNGSQAGLTKGARITGDQRSSLGETFGQRYASGESIRSIAIDTGRSYGFVHGVLKESGAALRGRGGATRGPRRGTAAQNGATEPVAGAGSETASPVRTKAKAKAEKDKPGKLVDQVADKVSEKVSKAKSVKDDKAKKKDEPKKPGKKGKKS